MTKKRQSNVVSLAFGNNMAQVYVAGLSKIVAIPVLDSPKCTTFGVSDKHQSTFLKSLSNIGTSYLFNQSIQFTCGVGNKGGSLHNVCAHYTHGSHHHQQPWNQRIVVLCVETIASAGKHLHRSNNNEKVSLL